MASSPFDGLEQQFVHVLWHSRPSKGFTDEKLLGVFSSKGEADAVIPNYSRRPGFRDLPGSFDVDLLPLDEPLFDPDDEAIGAAIRLWAKGRIDRDASSSNSPIDTVLALGGVAVCDLLAILPMYVPRERLRRVEKLVLVESAGSAILPAHTFDHLNHHLVATSYLLSVFDPMVPESEPETGDPRYVDWFKRQRSRWLVHAAVLDAGRSSGAEFLMSALAQAGGSAPESAWVSELRHIVRERMNRRGTSGLGLATI